MTHLYNNICAWTFDHYLFFACTWKSEALWKKYVPESWLWTTEQRTKNNADTQKKANLMSSQDRVDLFFRSFRFHLEIWITDRNQRPRRLLVDIYIYIHIHTYTRHFAYNALSKRPLKQKVFSLSTCWSSSVRAASQISTPTQDRKKLCSFPFTRRIWSIWSDL